MESTIITKFIIGGDEGISLLSALGATTAREKYGKIIQESKLEAYVLKRFSLSMLAREMNSLSNQFLVVYSNDEPAGYAWITSGGERPAAFAGKTVARIVEFGILREFDNDAVRKNLVEKCLSVCAMQQIVWVCEYDESREIDRWQQFGFQKEAGITATHQLGLAPVYLVRNKLLNSPHA
jgi:hypothetical protein